MNFFCKECGFVLKLENQLISSEVECLCNKFKIRIDNHNSFIIDGPKSDLDRAYKISYENISQEDLNFSMQNEDSLIHKAHYDFNKLGSVRGKRILEIGPGQGHLAKLLYDSGADLTLVDLVPGYLKKIQDEIPVTTILADVQKLCLFDSFDVIIICDVLEHVFRPSDVLWWLNKALRQDGVLYVRVPSHESNIFYSNSLGYPYELVHLRTYTRSLLVRELIASGFEISRRIRPKVFNYRIPKNWVPGVKRYWFIKRAILAKSSSDLESMGFIDRFLEGFLQARFSDKHRVLNFILIFIRIFYTLPVEIAVMAKKSNF